MQNNFSKTEKKPSGAEPAGAVKALKRSFCWRWGCSALRC